MQLLLLSTLNLQSISHHPEHSTFPPSFHTPHLLLLKLILSHSLVSDHIFLDEIYCFTLSLIHVDAGDQADKSASYDHLLDVLLFIQSLGSQFVPLEILHFSMAALWASCRRLATPATPAEQVVKEGKEDVAGVRAESKVKVS